MLKTQQIKQISRETFTPLNLSEQPLCHLNIFHNEAIQNMWTLGMMVTVCNFRRQL